jgi:hypothetical protein
VRIAWYSGRQVVSLPHKRFWPIQPARTVLNRFLSGELFEEECLVSSAATEERILNLFDTRILRPWFVPSVMMGMLRLLFLISVNRKRDK